jgi:hypothetical protein
MLRSAPGVHDGSRIFIGCAITSPTAKGAVAYPLVVMSSVIDTDVSEDLALLYPELYSELVKVSPSFSTRWYTC